MRFPLKPEGLAARVVTGTKRNECPYSPTRGCSVNAASRSLKINSSGKDGIETLPDFGLFENGKEGGDAGAGAEHHQIRAVGEAFGQEEAGGIFIEQDGVALLHFGETGRHGAVLDEYGKIFERVGIFCGNDGVGTPNKAFTFVETESGELSGFKTVGFGTADGESDEFRRVVFDPQNLFFGEFCFGRGCHVVVLECICRDYSQFGCFFPH